MYRCKECGTEYDIKPDYCDCGNDEFENLTNPKGNEKESSPEPKYEQNKSKKSENLIPKQSNSTNKSNDVQVKRMSTADILSIIIFGFCVLLSLYIIFFAWNPQNTEMETKEETEVKIAKNIPSIDTFWNNTPPIIKQETYKKEIEINKSNTVADEVKQTISTPAVTEKKKTVKMNTTSKTQKTTVSPAKKTTTLVKKTSVSAKASALNNQNQTQKQSEDIAKKKAEEERLKAEAEQLKKLQAEQAKKAAEEKAKQTAQQNQEFKTYKANLRNTIGRKIDFTRVIGDGSCTVAFRIDSSGKLVNRSFAKQSSNNTLNDAVYNAVMSTPTFNPPPSGYNNEILNLNIKFYNGNFEISLP